MKATTPTDAAANATIRTAQEPPGLADPLLTPAQMRALIPVAEPTQRHWRYQGTGPQWVVLGRRIFYRLSAIERWIADQERQMEAKRG